MKLTISRAEWLHGEGVEESYLLRERDGKKCCLGFLCLALGMDTEEISQVTTPAMLESDLPDELEALVDDFNADEFDERSDSVTCTTITQLNDTPLQSDAHGYFLETEEDRERQIAEVFGDAMGVEVVFVD